MLAQASIIGILPVHDLAAAQAFYGGKLGLTVEANDGFALVLRTAGGIMVRCALIPDAQPQPFTIFGWEVPDIHAAAKSLRAAAIEPILYPYFTQDEDGVWTAPDGSQVVWFHDPFGNVLSLSHHAASGPDLVRDEAVAP